MLNLHNIVRGAINANHQDEVFTLYRSVGGEYQDGLTIAKYEKVENIKGQFQSEGDSALSFANQSGQNTIVRKLYLYAPKDKVKRAWSVYRPLGRSGDYLVDKDNLIWLITAVTEDFSEVGWESVRCVLQQGNTPNFDTVQSDDEVNTDESEQ